MRGMKACVWVVIRLAAIVALGGVCAASDGQMSARASTRAAGNPEVRIRVQNPTGGMITKALVVIHHEWDEHANESIEEHKQDELMRVPFDGTADFAITLKPGFYDVYVSSHGYEPKCMKVHLPYGRDRALVFQLVDASWIYTPMVE